MCSSDLTTGFSTDAIRSDTLFVPFHWAGKKRANSLTGDWLDPTSRMPQFKVCAARIDKLVAKVSA